MIDLEKTSIGCAILAPTIFVVTLMVCLVTDSLTAFKAGLFVSLTLIAVSGLCLALFWMRES